MKKKRRSQRGRETPQLDRAREIVRAKLDADEPIGPHKLQAEYGISHVTFDMAITAELARRKVIAEELDKVDRSELSRSAQEKLDAAIRQHRRKLELEFDSRVSEEIKRRIDEIVLPEWKRQIIEAKEIMNFRKGIMDKDTFNKIRRCLHPDSRNTATKERLDDAFNEFMGLEKKLLNEKDSPTIFGDLPDTYEGWMRMRQNIKVNRAKSSVSKR